MFSRHLFEVNLYNLLIVENYFWIQKSLITVLNNIVITVQPDKNVSILEFKFVSVTL